MEKPREQIVTLEHRKHTLAHCGATGGKGREGSWFIRPVNHFRVKNTINAKSMLLTYAKSSTSTMEKKARTKWEKTYTDPNRNYKLQTSNKVDLQIIKDAIPKRPRTTSSVSGL